MKEDWYCWFCFCRCNRFS